MHAGISGTDPPFLENIPGKIPFAVEGGAVRKFSHFHGNVFFLRINIFHILVISLRAFQPVGVMHQEHDAEILFQDLIECEFDAPESGGDPHGPGIGEVPGKTVHLIRSAFHITEDDPVLSGPGLFDDRQRSPRAFLGLAGKCRYGVVEDFLFRFFRFALRGRERTPFDDCRGFSVPEELEFGCRQGKSQQQRGD